MKKVLMICAPAKSGKDTLFPLLKQKFEKNVDGVWERFAFADKLKQDCEQFIRDQFGISVWDDSKKHLFRETLINYGEKKRDETDGFYLIDHFLDTNSIFKNYIVTDFRFLNEFIEIEDFFTRKYGDLVHVVPIYIQRTFEKKGLKFVTQPSIRQEVINYPEIIENAYTWEIPWFEGVRWKHNLEKFIMESETIKIPNEAT
jgi:hypothetical protein